MTSEYVTVPREALMTEARRLRYRAGEAYGLGPAMTDAGAQMTHTAEALELLAAAPAPAAAPQTSGEARRNERAV